MENDIYSLIADLEEQINTGRKVPFTSHYFIDHEAALMLVHAISEQLPEAIKEANQVITQESRILSDAKKYAESQNAETDAKIRSMMADCQVRAERLGLESHQKAEETVELAKRQAADILEDAKRKAEELVAQNSIVTRAEKQSNEILSAARGEAQRTRMVTIDRCNDMLKHAEDVCIDVANQVRDSRMQINQER